MRVALVGPYPPMEGIAQGGVQTSFVSLVDGLAQNPELDLDVVTFIRGGHDETASRADGVRIRYLASPSRFSNLTFHLREIRKLRATLRDLQPDVVHAQDALGYGFTCLRARSPAPVVVSIHGVVHEELRHAEPGLERLRARLYGVRLQRYCIRHARYVVQPSTYPGRCFGSELRGKIWDVGNPISERFFSVPTTARAGHILHTGAMIPRKRLLDLVEAMPAILAIVPGTRLRVTGPQPDLSYASVVQERVARLGLAESVDFLGSLPFEELLTEYCTASLLVLPSGEETSPMVIREAMAARLPVVATNVGGIPDLVTDGVTGHLVEAGDVPSLVDRVVRILEDPDLAAALGQAGRAEAERNYRASTVSTRVLSVYEEALRDFRGAAANPLMHQYTDPESG